MSKLVPFLVFLLAFALRFGARLVRGREEFLANAYIQYIDLARNMLDNHDFALATNYGEKAAFWPPVYPTFVAVFGQGDRAYLPFVIASAVVGAITAVMAYMIGREIFDTLAGTFAGFCAAIYPYFVLHDVSIQETALFTCVTAVTIYLIVRARRLDSKALWIAAGIALGLTVLTRASVLPFVFLLFLWLLLCYRRRALLVAAAFFIIIAPWLIRNYYRIGEPVLTSQTGRFLWIAHNPSTFEQFPVESIDRSEDLAWSRVPDEEKTTILSMNEADQSDYFWVKGKEFILNDPKLAIKEGLKKIVTGFSWEFSPSASGSKQSVYFMSYFPVLIMGLWGMVLSRRRLTDLLPIYLLIGNFIVGTAVFWAHTSHRMFLEIYLMIFVGFTISWLWSKSKNFFDKTDNKSTVFEPSQPGN